MAVILTKIYSRRKFLRSVSLFPLDEAVNMFPFIHEQLKITEYFIVGKDLVIKSNTFILWIQVPRPKKGRFRNIFNF